MDCRVASLLAMTGLFLVVFFVIASGAKQTRSLMRCFWIATSACGLLAMTGVADLLLGVHGSCVVFDQLAGDGARCEIIGAHLRDRRHFSARAADEAFF